MAGSRGESIVLDIRLYARIVNSKFVRTTLQSTAYCRSIVFSDSGLDSMIPTLAGSVSGWVRSSVRLRIAIINCADRTRFSTWPAGEHRADPFLQILPFGANHADLRTYLRSLAPRQPGLIAALESAQAPPPIAAVSDTPTTFGEGAAGKQVRPLGTLACGRGCS
jgi:hypothetical protein